MFPSVFKRNSLKFTFGTRNSQERDELAASGRTPGSHNPRQLLSSGHSEVPPAF
jgi:hypothetical protein